MLHPLHMSPQTGNTVQPFTEASCLELILYGSIKAQRQQVASLGSHSKLIEDLGQEPMLFTLPGISLVLLFRDQGFSVCQPSVSLGTSLVTIF